jgi:acyl-CoA thioester hydrolase
MRPEALSAFPVITPIAIAWGDMDAFGHVNNTRYFRYFETARIAYFNQGRLLDGIVGPILASTACKFRAPVTFPDTVQVGARVMDIQADRFVMEHILWSDAMQTVAARGEAVIVSYDYTTKAKAPLPQAWLDAIAAIEGSAR